MKRVTARDKRDFKEINKIMEAVDEETRIYITGYAHGLCEKKNLLIATKSNDKNKGLYTRDQPEYKPLG